jgi:GNAT superfamily N-acetyltransferase
MQATPGSISVRGITANDCVLAVAAFAAQNWSKPLELFEKYLAEAAASERYTFVGEIDGIFAGYVTVVWNSPYEPFAESSIPEIVDLNVLTEFQRQGLGSRLLDAAEDLISSRSQLAGIRVALTSDYAVAHRLYLKRGYRPDGRGISYENRTLQHGDTATVDDNLALALIKDLAQQGG